MERFPSSGARHGLAHVYCICSFERGAVVPSVELIEAETDEDAIEVARCRSWLNIREVWDRHRLVAHITPEHRVDMDAERTQLATCEEAAE